MIIKEGVFNGDGKKMKVKKNGVLIAKNSILNKKNIFLFFILHDIYFKTYGPYCVYIYMTSRDSHLTIIKVRHFVFIIN